MARIQVKRGTTAALVALAASSGVLPGELYLLTDQLTIAIGLTSTTYQVLPTASGSIADGSVTKAKIADDLDAYIIAMAAAMAVAL